MTSLMGVRFAAVMRAGWCSWRVRGSVITGRIARRTFTGWHPRLEIPVSEVDDRKAAIIHILGLEEAVASEFYGRDDEHERGRVEVEKALLMLGVTAEEIAGCYS
jgi:hypothetical protein